MDKRNMNEERAIKIGAAERNNSELCRKLRKLYFNKENLSIDEM